MKHKLFALLGAGILFCSTLSGAAVAADMPQVAAASWDIAPNFIAITRAYSNLSLANSMGMMLCEGLTKVAPGYTAATTVELQRYTSSGWETIKSWYYAPNTTESSIWEYWYVDGGYTYRCHVTHQSLSGGRVIETDYSDSRTVEFY